jgi:hypothetical protein
MNKSALWGVFLAGSITGLMAASSGARAEEADAMNDDTTCWRDSAGRIVACSGTGRAGDDSGSAQTGRLDGPAGNRRARDTGTGPWVSNPGSNLWTLPTVNKRWNAPSRKLDWSIPPINRRWGNPR